MKYQDIKKLPKSWTEKIVQCREIASTPPMNKEGYWVQQKPMKVMDKKEDDS
jgi:hypothetical protein